MKADNVAKYSKMKNELQAGLGIIREQCISSLGDMIKVVWRVLSPLKLL